MSKTLYSQIITNNNDNINVTITSSDDIINLNDLSSSQSQDDSLIHHQISNNSNDSKIIESILSFVASPASSPSSPDLIETLQPSPESNIDKKLKLIKINTNETDLNNNEIEYINLTYDYNNGISKGFSYDNTYKRCFEIDENSRECIFFLPNESINIEIIGYEEEPSLGILHTNVYIINIKHADYNWTIKRKYKNFLKLYEEFALFKTKYNIRHPSDSSTNLSKFKSKDHFQLFFASFASDFTKAKYILEKFLNDVVQHKIFRYHNETLKFLEVSHLSFIIDLGDKTREGIIKKRSGGYKVNVGCCSTFSCSCCWDKRWLIVKDSWVAYLNPKSGEIRAVLLVDHKFQVSSGADETGKKNGLCIENESRTLYMKCLNEKRANEWRVSILSMLNKRIGKEFNKVQRFNSYAPIRDDSMVKWFVDGADYMESIADAIEIAQEEIFITGFFLSPELYLKRPVINGDKYRLDCLLKNKAEQGVKVYVLMYKEIEMALNINSAYAKRRLLHKNIKVLRHPDHMKDQLNSILWAHHEKLVIVDQSLAFFGGIDLCYGRWDNHLHKLTDLGSVVARTTTTPTIASSIATTVINNPTASSIETHAQVIVEESTKTPETTPEIDLDYVNDLINNNNKQNEKKRTKFLRMISSPAKVFESVIEASSNKDNKDGINEFNDNIFVNNNVYGDLHSPKSFNNSISNNNKRNFNYEIDKTRAVDSKFNKLKRSKSLELDDHLHQSNDDETEKDTARLCSSDGCKRGLNNYRTFNKSDPSIVKLFHKYKYSRFKGLKTLTSSINTRFRNSTKRDYHRELSKRVRRFKNNIKRYTIKRGVNYGDTNSEINSSFDDNHDNLDEDLFEDDDHPPHRLETLFEPSPNEVLLKELNLQGSSKLWFGKDYCNFIVKDFDNLKAPFKDVIDRNTMPRMPWHDVAGLVCGPAARDMARHFIQRWNYTKMKKAKNLIDYPLLLPKTYFRFKIPKKLAAKCSSCRVQCLRSVSNWSAGLSYTEASIHEAMKDLIGKSKYYIYIENQFFISLNDNNETTRNEISQCIYERIVRAHKEQEKFKVYVFIPLIPGYEGEYGRSSGVPLHTITHYNNKTIKNLFKKLNEASIEPLNYICFFSLRTWSELNGKLVSELIYVHSKLMIVDDRACIIGSANINDRSLLGTRDSEFALVIEDTQFINGTLNKTNVDVGRFCSSLRKRLFREFLGDFDDMKCVATTITQHNNNSIKTSRANSLVNGKLTDSPAALLKLHNRAVIDLHDPCSDDFYKHILLKFASQNTKIFEDTFNVIPCDKIKTFEQLKEHRRLVSMSISNPDEARAQLLNVKGYIVLYPSRFLECENLTPPLLTKEKLLPTSLWT